MKRQLMMSTALLWLIVAQPAIAQDIAAADGAQPAAAASADDTVTGEVIVTATRRNERLRDVPLSITAFSQEKLTANGIVGFEGLARETPGIVLNKPTANFNTFTARGIATNGYGANLQSTVAIYMDELPISRTGNTTLLDPNLFDVERVEFLRGPQGTLFGSGSLAGALRILTKSPVLNKFDASGLVDIGLTGSDSVRQRYNAMVNLPLVEDKIGLRVAGFYRHEEGWVDNIQTGVKNANTLKDYGGRAILLFKPTDRLAVRLLGSFENSLPQDSSLINRDLGKNRRRSVRPDIFSGKQRTGNATIEYQFDGAHLTSSSTYAHFDQKFYADISGAVGRLFPYVLEAGGPEKSFVQETRLASDPGGKFDWVVGVFYFDRRTQLENRLGSSTAFLASRGITGGQGDAGDAVGSQVLRLKTDELAGFGELTYHFNDRLWATGGLRYGRTESQLFNRGGYTTDYITKGLTGTSGPLVISPVAAAEQPKIVGKRASYKASLSYRVTDTVTSYALVSTGYRAPTLNASAGRPSLVDPTDLTIPYSAGSDKLINYELGAKGSLFDGKLVANLALYWIDWRNIQVQANRVSDSAQFSTNIGAARSRGLEFEVTARPVRNLSFGVNGSFNGTKITKLSPSEAAISGAVLGDRLSSPKFQGSLFIQPSFDLSATTSGYVNLNVQRVGSFPSQFPNVPGRPTQIAPTFGITDSYETVNLSLGLKSGDLSAILYVENALNDNSTTYLHPEGFLDAKVGTQRPRTIGIRVGYNL